jgi:hypothetical protein
MPFYIAAVIVELLAFLEDRSFKIYLRTMLPPVACAINLVTTLEA